MTVTRFSPATLLATVFLASCGGGGGGGGSTPVPPPPAASTYQVSGQISVAANTLVDSDVNDVLAAYASNDDFATAQALPNPVSLAGYVNEPGAGGPGRSQANGDTDDFFRIDAIAGQTVSLIVGDPTSGDIDLYLLDGTTHAVVAKSVGTGKLESIPITASGRYYAVAEVFSGASTYVLTLGQPVAASAEDGTLVSTADFVPGEVIVRWRTQTTAQRGGLRSAASVMSAHALSKVAATAEGGDWLLKLDNPASALQQTHQKAMALQEGQATTLTVEQHKSATLQAIKRLRADPGVAYAEPNYIRRAQAVPVDQYYSLQWHYPLINLPAAWDITTGGTTRATPITVAVIDTGVLINHPDLQGQLVAGYDFITDPTRARDGNGPDNNPDDPGDNNTPGGSSSFHGTHVAGTIAASSNTTRGVAGIAWNARIMPLRVLGVGGGTSFDIGNAVLYAARLANSSGTLPAQRADIINLSLGGGSFSQAEQDAYSQARAAGVIIVAAAGNEATSVPQYPASYDGVISVSAVSINKTLASYSNSGVKVDIAAPGGDSGDANGDGYQDLVLSTVGDDSSGSIVYGYGLKAGTSMATPHVAGVLALMKAVNPALTPNDIDTMLVAGRLTVDIGAPGRDDSFGYGLIDALKAVQAAQNGTGNTPALLVAAPGALNFAPGTSTQTLTASNGGSAALQVTAVQVTPASSWLTVTPPAGATGLGAYTVSVSRGSLPAGAYTTSIRLVSAANTVTVPVVMQVSSGSTSLSPDLGQQYVLLVHADTLVAAYQVNARATAGVYTFQFTDVAPGNYKLFTGSDADNNDKICDVGESCGAYISLDNPATLSISGNRSGLNFSAGYTTSIGANALGSQTGPLSGGIKRLH